MLPLHVLLFIIAEIYQSEGRVKHNGHKQPYLNTHRDQGQAAWGPLQQLPNFEAYQEAFYIDYLRQRKKMVLNEIINTLGDIKLKLAKEKQKPNYIPFVVPCPFPYSEALYFNRDKKSSGAQSHQVPNRKIHSSSQDTAKANDPQPPITLNDRGNFQSDDEAFARRIESFNTDVRTSKKLQRRVRGASSNFDMPQLTYLQDYNAIYREEENLMEINAVLSDIRQELARRNEQQPLRDFTPYPMAYPMPYPIPYPLPSHWPYSVPCSISPGVAPTANGTGKKTDNAPVRHRASTS